jgi:type I restriction enzyme S subunit
MQNICFLTDGEKKEGETLPYLDVKYLRGKGFAKMMSSGRFVSNYSTMILVDGENSGEIFSVLEDGYQGSTFKILNISNFVDKYFIFKILQKEQFAFKESKVGSAIPHLDKKLFRELLIFLPPLAEQKRIVSKIENLFQTLDSIQNNL